MTTDETFRQAGVDIEHYFGAREYAKKACIPAGVVLTQHQHLFSHLSILSSGRALVTVDGVATEYGPNACILIDAGATHSVQALTDVVWFCIHGTDNKNPDTVDAGLIQ